MKLQGIDLLEHTNPDIQLSPVKDSLMQGAFVTFSKKDILAGGVSGFTLPQLTNWLGLYRCNIYWIIPSFGTAQDTIPEGTQYLLWQREDGLYGIILPLIDGDLRATLKGEEDGIRVIMNGALPGEEPDEACLLFTAFGENPYELTHQAVKAVRDKLNTFKLREEKVEPEFVNYLGWCTWDAFYGSVDEEKVIMGLDSFKAGNFPLGFMILDDGSWDAHGDNLNDIQVNPNKFTNGLGGLITNAKENYGIKIFGVWHCFEGYWGGINPEGPLAKRYKLLKNSANIRPWEEVPKTQDIYLIHPEDILKFYHEFHQYLYNEGADMLKIDGQCALELFTEGTAGRVSTMKKFQYAMQSASSLYFDGNVIHCMSNSTDVAYNMLATNVWRNNYDYAPHDPDMQQPHILINAMNSMWASTFSLPDWDMFQSHSTGAEMHAAARSISGGPVYVCDYPGKQNFDILRKMATSDGLVLRCDRPALPTRDRIFVDSCNEKKLLKIFNFSGDTGVLGIFHCEKGLDPIRDTFKPSDVEGLTGERFAAYYNQSKKLRILNKNAEDDITLGKMDYEIVTFTPIVNGIAALGLLDKYNSAAAVTAAEWELDGSYVAQLRDGGNEIGFYCEKKPATVWVNGEEVLGEYDAEMALLTVQAVTGSAVTIRIFM